MNNPIRILHVFGGMGRGGAETMAMNLYRNIDRNKIQFDFVVHTEEKCDYDDEIISMGGKIYRIPRYNGKNHFDYKKEWNEFFKKYPEYKIIHGHMRSTASIYLNLAKKFGLVTIAHSHNSSSGKGISAIVKTLMQYKIRYIADYMFACSNDAGIWLFGKNHCKKENFFILKNAIDAKKFIYDEEKRKNIRKKFKIEDKFVIGHIGRFHQQKNHKFLIYVFYEIYKRNKDSVLILVGDGELKEQIRSISHDLGIEKNIIFTGVRSDIEEIIQAMDIMIFPSLYEGLPLTLLEVQVSGLPCIISDSITKSVDITNNIKFISLELTKEIWAKEALKYISSKKRQTRYEEIVKSGYDIKNTATWYKEFCELNYKGRNI